MTTTLRTRSASKFVLATVGARFLTNSPMLSVGGLTGCQLNHPIQRENFSCDRRESTDQRERVLLKASSGFRAAGGKGPAAKTAKMKPGQSNFSESTCPRNLFCDGLRQIETYESRTGLSTELRFGLFSSSLRLAHGSPAVSCLRKFLVTNLENPVKSETSWRFC